MPRDRLLIGEDKIIATAAAMLEYAPYLVQVIAKIKNEPPLQTVMNAPLGGSAHSQYLMPLSAQEVAEIIKILEQIQVERGYNAKFHNRQVNLLIEIWKEHARHLEPKQCNTSPTALPLTHGQIQEGDSTFPSNQ